jgi:hypothetical protein
MNEFQKAVVGTFERLKGATDVMTDAADTSKPLDPQIKEQVHADIDSVIKRHEGTKPWPTSYAHPKL